MPQLQNNKQGCDDFKVLTHNQSSQNYFKI